MRFCLLSCSYVCHALLVKHLFVDLQPTFLVSLNAVCPSSGFYTITIIQPIHSPSQTGFFTHTNFVSQWFLSLTHFFTVFFSLTQTFFSVFFSLTHTLYTLCFSHSQRLCFTVCPPPPTHTHRQTLFTVCFPSHRQTLFTVFFFSHTGVSTGPSCVRSCKNLPDGDYQSCEACDCKYTISPLTLSCQTETINHVKPVIVSIPYHH